MIYRTNTFPGVPEIGISKRATYFWIVLSGLLLTAAFPPWSSGWIAWFSLVPLFKALEGQSPYRAFRLGLAAGVVHYLTLVYWIVVVLGRYGNLHPAASGGILILLCLYLALYLGLFSLITRLLEGARFLPLFLAAGWVSLEYARTHLVTGFPWCLLGYTQHDRLSLIQSADLTGVYGLSFLIVLVNATLYLLIFKRRGGFFKRQALITAVLLLFTLAYGWHRLAPDTTGKEERSLRAVAVQGNIDQSLKWDEDYREATLKIYERLTRSAYGFEPHLVVWPETAVPFFFQDNGMYGPKLVSLVRESGADLVFGSPAYRGEGEGLRYYNRAYLLPADGKGIQAYDKVHLVPFGEYVPLKRLLVFVNRLVTSAGDFQAGDRIAPLNSKDFSSGVLICFEAIFPRMAREQTRAGAHVLINITNDAWFGNTSAPHQHLSMSVFRAVENRRPLIRSANTGFSAFVDSAGRVQVRSGLFEEGVLMETVALSEPSMTFYTRHGDLFARLMLLLTALSFLPVAFHRKHKSGPGGILK
jgi:apolipoprotein N-acyltransferase